VAFLDPPFLGEATGTGADDHPFNDVRAGEAFLNRIYQAVTSSPAWSSTVLIINFDEWGGFFDHVPPSIAPLPDTDRALGSDGWRGFRTPALVISPFARREHTSHALYDHTSVLRLIEWRWNLEPLSVRDASANNLAAALESSTPGSARPPTWCPPSRGPHAPPGRSRRSPRPPAPVSRRAPRGERSGPWRRGMGGACDACPGVPRSARAVLRPFAGSERVTTGTAIGPPWGAAR
jgi:phospholipase C